jgi:TolA-binding protein
MNELEPLASVLRKELGVPPPSFLEEQRFRVRRALSQRRRSRPVLAVSLVATACALAAALVFVVVSSQHERPTERWLVASELPEPFRLDDGSTIALREDARGRLSTDASEVRFDLHAGRALFDVRPDRKRSWTITAGKNEVHVIGTRFSVSYGPSDALEVEVERGMVSVQIPDRRASIALEAGDRLRGGSGRVEVARTDRAAAASARAGARSAPPAPVAPSAPPAPDSVGSSPPRSSESATAANGDWQARYREGMYAESLRLLRESGVGQRLNALPAATLAEIGEVARLGGDPELAVRALTALTQRFPSSPEARHAKFLLGRLHALRGDGAAATTALESYLRAGDASPYATEAIGRLMELYSGRGDTERARHMARRYLERAPGGPYRRLARSLTGQTP